MHVAVQLTHTLRLLALLVQLTQLTKVVAVAVVSASSRSQMACPPLLPSVAPLPPPSSRIVGGRTASAGLASYVVQLQIRVKDDSYKCTGTLVSGTTVLTATHCLRGVTDAAHQVTVRACGEPQVLHVAAVDSRYERGGIVPSADPYWYDLSVVMLAREAPARCRFMAVSFNDSLPVERSAVRVAGFGAVNGTAAVAGEDVGDVDDAGMPVLRTVDVWTTGGDQCTLAFNGSDSHVHVNSSMQACAGDLRVGGCDSCLGDSGGPMLQLDDTGEPVLVGIVSTGKGCGQAAYPGVYLRTGAHADFLSERGLRAAYRTRGEEDHRGADMIPSVPSASPRAERRSGKQSGLDVVLIVIVCGCGFCVLLGLVLGAVWLRRRAARRAEVPIG